MGLGHRRRQRDRLGEDIPGSQLASGPDQAVRQRDQERYVGHFHSKIISRGGENKRNWTTTNLKKHAERHHKMEFRLVQTQHEELLEVERNRMNNYFSPRSSTSTLVRTVSQASNVSSQSMQSSSSNATTLPYSEVD
ncbi:unnamed protein product [Meganyctiphanes norvegica]|uniref:Uncharacterized protein n=1 Tax=Meganyctiphanes norvegica TaxID=48144 RepID=A0AAV2SNW6_MEGNR